LTCSRVKKVTSPFTIYFYNHPSSSSKKRSLTLSQTSSLPTATKNQDHEYKSVFLTTEDEITRKKEAEVDGNNFSMERRKRRTEVSNRLLFDSDEDDYVGVPVDREEYLPPIKRTRSSEPSSPKSFSSLLSSASTSLIKSEESRNKKRELEDDDDVIVLSDDETWI